MISVHRLLVHYSKFSLTLNVSNKKLFFIKINFSISESLAEYNGYSSLSKFVDLPKRVFFWDLKFCSITGYYHWGTLENNTGLLVDIINTASDIEDYLNQYKLFVFKQLTTTYGLLDQSLVVNKLYSDRTLPGNRLFQYYTNNIISLININSVELIVNEEKCSFSFQSLVNEVMHFFHNQTKVHSIISQGDPTDINLGVPFTFFDYECSGRNDIIGEFANFLTNIYFYGGYIVPKYKPKLYKYHSATLSNLKNNTPMVDIIYKDKDFIQMTLNENLTPERQFTVRKYLNEIVYPVCREIGINDVSSALRPYIIMRLIGVFNIFQYDPMDQMYMIAKLAECTGKTFNLESFFNSDK